MNLNGCNEPSVDFLFIGPLLINICEWIIKIGRGVLFVPVIILNPKYANLLSSLCSVRLLALGQHEKQHNYVRLPLYR